MAGCITCGASLRNKRLGTKFCSQECGRARHNVKMLRGARIHDLLIEWRSDYKKRHLLTRIGQEVACWIREDETK